MDTECVLGSGVLRLNICTLGSDPGRGWKGWGFAQKPVSLALELASCHFGRVAEGCPA